MDALFERLGGTLPVADEAAFNVFNERIRTTWFDPANAGDLHQALDDLLTDLN